MQSFKARMLGILRDKLLFPQEIDNVVKNDRGYYYREK